ncbi:tyrosine-protein phosphatase [Eubacteriales bacterium OttesenSCG-928-M02]|nr:tyrosine-protein phosphatase [Eubacteriales bacterium OttesenSCG-928-M02]
MLQPQNLPAANPPLPLTASRNVRDLGGYPTADGKETQFHVLLRGGDITHLTEEDLSYLYTYGVRQVVDLRGTEEAETKRDKIRGYKDVAYVHAPMFESIHSNFMQGPFPDDWDGMVKLYYSLLEDSKAAIRKAFSAIAAAPGATLFHCTAGKDRTGILSMLLLRLAGVPDAMIITDYQVSFENNSALMERLMAERMGQDIDVPVHVFYSKPEYMEKALAYLDDTYGSAQAYLLQIGVTQQELDAIIARLVG